MRQTATIARAATIAWINASPLIIMEALNTAGRKIQVVKTDIGVPRKGLETNDRPGADRLVRRKQIHGKTA